MNKLIKQLEQAIEKHTHLYYEKPEQAEQYAEKVYALAEQLAALNVGHVYCKAASGKLAWFNVETYQFD